MVGAVLVGTIGSIIGLLISYHAATSPLAPRWFFTTVVIFLLGLVASSVERLRNGI
ncbi:MAG: hypothetical protein R2697_03055 [Ilumatobacteraceae bacterium]